MNESDSIVRKQADALKQLLEQSRNAHCRTVHDQAEAQAAEIRKRARRAARDRVSKAAHEERARLERELRLVEAEIETERRRRGRLRDSALIEAGRAALASALAKRWGDPAERAEWAEAAVIEAGEVLLGRAWVLEHPASWAADEREQALAFARERCGVEIEAQADEALAAGLRVRTDGASVDMSVAGLLANERSLEGALLAEFNRVAEGENT
jgi:F0F1-type ATP synthase membrane subunit b/b'